MTPIRIAKTRHKKLRIRANLSPSSLTSIGMLKVWTITSDVTRTAIYPGFTPEARSGPATGNAIKGGTCTIAPTKAAIRYPESPETPAT